jgi:tetratricopeptide (TPR) repeat protein
MPYSAVVKHRRILVGLSVLSSAAVIGTWVFMTRGRLQWVSKRAFDWTYERDSSQSPTDYLDQGWPRWASIPTAQVQLRLHLLRRLRSEGDTINALEVAADCLAILRSRHLPHNLQFDCLTDIARTYEWCEDLGSAIPLREESWLIEKRKHGANSPRAIIAMEWVAIDGRRLGYTVRAESLLREALALWLPIEGEDGPHSVHTEMQLGITLQMAGQPEEAKALLEDGLARVEGKDSFVIGALAQLASAHSSLGDHDLAIRSQLQALDLHQATSREDDPLTLTWKRNLAMFYWKAGDLNESERVLSQVIDTYQGINREDSLEADDIRELLVELRSQK